MITNPNVNPLFTLTLFKGTFSALSAAASTPRGKSDKEVAETQVMVGMSEAVLKQG